MQGDIVADLLRDTQDYAWRLILLKAWGGDGYVVASGRQGGHRILTVAVSGGGTIYSTSRAGHRNLGIDDGSAAWIFHATRERGGVLGLSSD